MIDKMTIRNLKKNLELQWGDGYFLLILRDKGTDGKSNKKVNIQLSKSVFNPFELIGLLEYSKQEILKEVVKEVKE